MLYIHNTIIFFFRSYVQDVMASTRPVAPAYKLPESVLKLMDEF